MAKGDYLAKFGGSKNAYNKGKKDAQKDLLMKIGQGILKLLSGEKK